MRIGVDSRSLFEPRPSGVTEVVRNLLTECIRQFPEHQFVLFFNQWRRSSDDRIFQGMRASNVEWRRLRFPNKLLHGSIVAFRRPHWDELINDVDLLFFPNLHFASFSSRVPSVLMVHDLSFAVYPELLPLFRRWWHRSLRAQHVCKTASHLIAISENTKQDLQELYGIPNEKISVIGHGLAPEFFLPVSEERKAALRRKYRLPEHFVLMLSNQERRKNFDSALQAIRMVQSTIPELVAVVAGGGGWGTSLRWKNSAEVRVLGYLPSEDRAALYACADLFLFPSLYEGFGLPPLEAMAMGVPVIAAHSSSLPEVLHDAALLIDPYRKEELAQAVTSVFSDEHLRQRLIEAGRARSQLFRWERSAAALVQLFHHLITQPSYAHRN